MSQRLVIIAGEGQFPILVAKGAKRAGHQVCVLGLTGLADPCLEHMADRFQWIPIARIGRWIKLAGKFHADELILAGGVRKAEAFSPWRIWRYLPDWRALRVWYRRAQADRRNLAILSALVEELELAGLHVADSTKYCPDALAHDGLITHTQPSDLAKSDMEFGFPIAIKIAAMDIGQAIAVREKDIVAVEAIEGTDAMIERAGTLAKSGWVLIKVAQSHQDMRYDVPTVGPETIERLHTFGAAALMIEADKTLMIEKEKMIQMADQHRIAIVGKIVPSPPAE